eukprot:SAG31_NODE_20421_length_575_cov_0.754202_2_plen_56_part_01
METPLPDMLRTSLRVQHASRTLLKVRASAKRDLNDDYNVLQNAYFAIILFYFIFIF